MSRESNGRSGILFLAVFAVAVVFSFVIKAKGHSEKPVPKCEVNLNASLSNSMSDSLGLDALDADIESYMREWGLHGTSLAIMRNDSLLFAKGYGESDYGVQAGPGTLMRLASVSKLVTAVGIMTLVERDSLSLDDTVFGEGDLLEEFRDVITDPKLFRITIRHLLKHEAGFTVYAGDPMFATVNIMRRNGWKEPPTSEKLARNMLKYKLAIEPGTEAHYSNFGYMLLSLVIERATGEEYETWMQENVLKMAGCRDFHLGGNFYEDRFPTETRYYMQRDAKTTECYDGSLRQVERCYGGNDVHALKGAGAWIASAPELARLVASIDGKDNVPDILSIESIAEMTAPTDSVTYALGWNDISEDGTWTRTGTLSGTSALVKYYPDGECWIMISNTSTWKGPRFTSVTASLFKKSREKFSALLPERDLFYDCQN